MQRYAIWSAMDVIDQCNMNNQILKMTFSSIMPDNEVFDIQVYTNDTILCCQLRTRIPEDKTLNCDLRYECLNFLFFIYEELESSHTFKLSINDNELSYYPCDEITISHPSYEYIENSDFVTLKNFESDILCPNINKTSIDKGYIFEGDEENRIIHNVIMVSSSIFVLASNIITLLFLI